VDEHREHRRGGVQVAGEQQADCLFCKIVAGEVPATVVRETATTVAFRDINPQAPTHVLVIPRVHYPDAASLAAAEPQIVADLLRETAEVAAQDKIDETGYRVVFNTGTGAGQTVFHAHAHVLGGRGLQWPPG
jgi:histidine triad (HIT) family protein